MQFSAADRMFKQDKIRELGESTEGLRYLKLRTLSRKEHMQSLFVLTGQKMPQKPKEMFRRAYENASISDSHIEQAISTIYESKRALRLQQEPTLVSELYKMQAFDWGGLHQNSLEKTIVDNYVKKIADYDTLTSRIENELLLSMRGYVLCSWYNHWTSIIIEDIFRDHNNVVPAVGQVKKIDFFVRNVPFDLKVTYMPEGFLKDCRKIAGLKSELTLLKQAARTNSIVYDRNASDAMLLEDLWRKVADHPGKTSKKLIAELKEFRLNTLAECQADHTALIRWLYENQGVRRFDASNRLFLVLVDKSDFFASWRLKRAKPLLENKINEYLDDVSDSPGQTLDFTWDSETFTTISDVVFIVHPESDV